ncbi:MAG: hypothetical protein CSA81_06410 [Acidobacteria bacterium]|nr:MAG: hypothetical protein CSA81_06410 [Acidobacteriota bacterium]
MEVTMVPYPEKLAVRSVAIDILLTLLTCGLWGLYWQYKQMEVLNAWLNREEYSFVLWLLLSIITCGIYAIYYEYKMAKGINEIQLREGLLVNSDLAVLCMFLTFFGLGIVSLAIQQADINKFYHSDGVY